MSRTLTLGQAAIGPKDGDYIELANQWARVVITVWADDSDRPASPTLYVVTGDTLDFRLSRVEFCTMGAAITYAMRSLAVYQEGRAS